MDSKIGRAKSRSFSWLARLLADRSGAGDLTTYLLMTAAGAAMVGITVPSLFSSSNSAAQTFQNQVKVLEQGAGGGGASSLGGGDLGSAASAIQGAISGMSNSSSSDNGSSASQANPSGVTISGGPGGVTVSGANGSITAGPGGASVTSGGGGAPVTGGGAIQSGSSTSITKANQALINSRL